MVSEDEFNEVQKRLGRYDGKAKQKTHDFAYAGIMKCGSCGAAITAEEKRKRQKNGNTHSYIYYHCTKRKDKHCPEKVIEQKELEQQIDFILQKFQISEAYKDWAIRFVNEPRKDQEKQRMESASQKQKRIGEVAAQLEAMFLKYASPANTDGSLIADNEYRTAKMKLEKEKANLERNIADADAKDTELADLTEKTFKFACYARAWFNEGSQKDRRRILLSLGSNFSLTGKILNVDLHLPWKVIADEKEKVEAEVQEVRTSGHLINTSQLFTLSRKFLTLRSLVFDVLTYFQKRTEYLYIPKLSCAISQNHA
jgi:hypothetical protein